MRELVEKYLIVGIAFSFLFFFFNDTATTEIYTLSLHDALPICIESAMRLSGAKRTSISAWPAVATSWCCLSTGMPDRKSTRLNSSHSQISYAVFCLEKKNRPRRRPGRVGLPVRYPDP